MTKKTQQIEEFWESSIDTKDLISQAQQFLCTLNKSYKTITSYYHNLRYFILWCHQQQTQFPQQLTNLLLSNYKDYTQILTSKKYPQKPLSKDAKNRRILHVKHFLKWLIQNEEIAANIHFPQELPAHKQFWQQPYKTNDLVSLAKKFLEIEALTSKKIKDTKHYLRYFIEWCHQREITIPSQINSSNIDLYQNYVSQLKSSKSNKTVSFANQKDRLIAIINLSMTDSENFSENFAQKNND